MHFGLFFNLVSAMIAVGYVVHGEKIPVRSIDVGIVIDFALLETQSEIRNTPMASGRDGLQRLIDSTATSILDSNNDRSYRIGVTIRGREKLKRDQVELAARVEDGTSGQKVMDAIRQKLLDAKQNRDENRTDPSIAKDIVVSVRKSANENIGRRPVAGFLIVWIAMHQSELPSSGYNDATFGELKKLIELEGGPDIAVALWNFSDAQSSVHVVNRLDANFFSDPISLRGSIDRLVDRCISTLSSSECYFKKVGEDCSMNHTYTPQPNVDDKSRTYCTDGVLVGDCDPRSTCVSKCNQNGKRNHTQCTVTCGHGTRLARPLEASDPTSWYAMCPWENETRSMDCPQSSEVAIASTTPAKMETWVAWLIVLLVVVIVIVVIIFICICSFVTGYRPIFIRV